MLRIFPIAGLIVILLFISCRKEPSKGHGFLCDQITKTHIEHAQLLKCKFKANSIWIYKDSVTGAFDTSNVSSTKSFFAVEHFQAEGCDSLEHYYASFHCTETPNHLYYESFILEVM